MLGVVNKAIEHFIRATYGDRVWHDAAEHALVSDHDIEPMLMYSDEITYHLIDGLIQTTGKPRQDVLDDLGTFLVTPPHGRMVRRLLRFGGATFDDFLISMGDLNDRVALALPDLDLPTISVDLCVTDRAVITVENRIHGFANVLQGLLRAMADDYGTLVFIDIGECDEKTSQIVVILSEQNIAQGAEFNLAG